MQSKLNVNLFGGFSAYYGETALTFGKQNNSKFSQLFQLLMTRPKQDFSKRTLIHNMYEADEIENPNDSLNSTIFRLRQYLKKSPLPKGEYFIVKGGTIRFDGPVEVISDVWEFDCLEKDFEKEQDLYKRAECCKQACDLYKGEFLPQLASEQWVMHRANEYKEKYKKMLIFLLEYFKGKKAYGQIEQYASRAMRMYPLEGWEIWVIDSMVAQGHFQEVGNLYQDLVKKVNQIEKFSSIETIQWLKEIEDHVLVNGESPEKIYQNLNEEEGALGAYCCSFLGFTDYFRILKRLSNRENIQFRILVCNLVKIDGSPIENKSSCLRLGEKLKETFKSHLRIGDVYTKYNINQYLVLCVSANEENIRNIGARIDIDFQKRCNRRYGISYYSINPFL